eukprot:tig00021721_g23223.t1
MLELAGSSVEVHVALTRRICTLVSRHACGPNETGAAPRTSPRAWPFSGLGNVRWPCLVNLAELRRLSVSLELPPRSSDTSERAPRPSRRPGGPKPCHRRAFRRPRTVPTQPPPLHEGAADALLSGLGEGPLPGVSRLELAARRFLGYEDHHLRSLLGRLPALAALALRTQPTTRSTRGQRWPRACGACARGPWRAGWGPLPPWAPWRGLRCPSSSARLAAVPAARRLACLDLAGSDAPEQLEPAALAAAARLPALRSLAFPLDSDAQAPVFPVQEAGRALGSLGAAAELRELSVAVRMRRYGPGGARPERPLLAALASRSNAPRSPPLSALPLRLVRRPGDPAGCLENCLPSYCWPEPARIET